VSRPSRQTDPPFDLASARGVLIVKPSSLGDVVHTLPAVERLHRAHPDLAIDWVVNTEWAPLLEGNPALRRIIPLPRRDWRGWRDLPKAKRWATETLGPLRPDLVLDFQGLLRSALIAKASGGAHVIGFRDAREGAPLFYHRKVTIDDWHRTHAVDRYLQLAIAAGAPVEDPATVRFPLPAGDPVAAPAGPDDPPFLLLHPFSRGRGKSMSFAEVATLCRRLGEIPVILVGSGVTWPDEVTLPENTTPLLGQTSLAQLIWLMRRARWIASVDSGPMHLAAGLTGNLLSIHTWTDPLMVGPWRKDAWVWRDGYLGTIAGIEPGRFPENRRDRSRFESGVLPGDSIDQVAAFLADRMAGG
jgi:heptosyltransferase-1